MDREREFFTIPTRRGLDLPSLSLRKGAGYRTAAEGLQALLSQTVKEPATTACVGYVRNVVPAPDPHYPHPAPLAHVPVFMTGGPAEPAIPGSWVTLNYASNHLTSRHWWPIVEHQLHQA